MLQVGAQYGWICPICNRVLAPFVQECPCRGQGPETFWTTTTASGEIKTCVPDITKSFDEVD